MKGLLSGMCISSLVAKSPKRRRRGGPGNARKKSRNAVADFKIVEPLADKSLEVDTAVCLEDTEREVAVDSGNLEEKSREADAGDHCSEDYEVMELEVRDATDKVVKIAEPSGTSETPELALKEQQLLSATTSSITFTGDSAIVNLRGNQKVAMDGWAMVSLREGRASVHGYYLSQGVAVLLCSNTNYAAAVDVEAVNVDGRTDAAQLSESEAEKSASRKACVLEFKSYRGVGVDFSDEPVVSNEPTFRLEVQGDIGPRKDLYVDYLISKRKREKYTSEMYDIEDQSARKAESIDDDTDRATSEFDEMDIDEQDEVSGGDSDNESRRKAQKIERTPLQATVIPLSWQIAANSIGSHRELSHGAPVIAVCGPKGSGKSTFGRFLLNSLLNSYEAVGYLDTDVGQPEFTVPGCLSLHVLTKPVFGHFFYGAVTPKADPGMYCETIEALYDFFQQKYGGGYRSKSGPEIPLIINTHGWIKGLGFDVLVSLLRTTHPSHFVLIQSKASKYFPTGNFWNSSDDSVILTVENALEGANMPLTCVRAPASQLRDARILAYFHQCFGRRPLPYNFRKNRLFAKIALDLVRHPPYQVPLSAVKICHMHCQVPSSERFVSLNGSLVGLGVTWKSEKKYDAVPTTLCVGIGIVRSVDPDKGVLYLITPEHEETLQTVDTLMQGWVEIPVPLLQAKGYVSPYLCHHSVAMAGTGSFAIKNAYDKFSKIPRAR